MDILSNNKISDTQFLRLCASITKGNTIYLGDFSLVPISSWWNLIKRRWHSEDRNIVLRYLDLRISKILSDLYAGIRNVILDDLIAATSGLRQFSLTYEDDIRFKEELSIIINKMDHAIKSEKERAEVIVDPEFSPTLSIEKPKSDVKTVESTESYEGPLVNTLKKIRTWSDMYNRSPPHFNSLINGIKSLSCDSILIPMVEDNIDFG